MGKKFYPVRLQEGAQYCWGKGCVFLSFGEGGKGRGSKEQEWVKSKEERMGEKGGGEKGRGQEGSLGSQCAGKGAFQGTIFHLTA